MAGGMIPGVLLHVNRAYTLGVFGKFFWVVGVEDVCVLLFYCMSNFSVAWPQICASCSNACPCHPVSMVGSCMRHWIAPVSCPAIVTVLSMGVSRGSFTCVEYSIY